MYILPRLTRCDGDKIDLYYGLYEYIAMYAP